jgi:hypothetical protein
MYDLRPGKEEFGSVIGVLFLWRYKYTIIQKRERRCNYRTQKKKKREGGPLQRRSKSKSLRRLNDPRPGLVRRMRIPSGSRRLRFPLRIFLHLALSIVLSVPTLLLGRVLFLMMMLLLMRHLLVASWSSGPRVIRGGLPLRGRGSFTVRLYCRAV